VVTFRVTGMKGGGPLAPHPKGLTMQAQVGPRGCFRRRKAGWRQTIRLCWVPCERDGSGAEGPGPLNRAAPSRESQSQHPMTRVEVGHQRGSHPCGPACELDTGERNGRSVDDQWVAGVVRGGAAKGGRQSEGWRGDGTVRAGWRHAVPKGTVVAGCSVRQRRRVVFGGSKAHRATIQHVAVVCA